MAKWLQRITGVLLSAIMLFVSYIALPAKAIADEAARTVLAEEIEAYAAENDFSQDNSLAYSPLVGEIQEERDESVKVFRRVDGAQEAVVYSDPIHYLDGEAWETIDNTLELVTLEDGTQAYRNKANDFIVLFSPYFNAENLITVESKGHILSWRFTEDVLFAQQETAETQEEPEPAEEPDVPGEDAVAEPIEDPADGSVETEDAEAADAEGTENTDSEDAELTVEDNPEEVPSEEPVSVEPEATETEELAAEEPEVAEPEEPTYETLKITDAKAEVADREQKELETDEERDMLLRFPEELTSELTYKDPETGLNVHYVLSGKRLSEQIVLDHAPETAIAYTTLLTTNGLKAEEKDGRIVLVDESGEAIFEIMPPVMYDVNGEESAEIEVRMVETGDGYAYTLIPNEKWLKDESRVFPVVLDPDINPSFVRTVNDVHISEVNPNQNYYVPAGSNTRPHRLKLGGTNKYRSLIQITTLPELKTGDVIIEAHIGLSRYNESTSNNYKEVDLYKILVDWDQTTVTWNSLNPTNPNSVEQNHIYSIATSASFNHFSYFNITDLVKQWYANPQQNHGMLLESPDNRYLEYKSSEYNSTYSGHPYYSIIYINSTGLESRFTYHSQSAGRAGTGSINDYSGNLTWTFEDANITNGVLPISLSHVYNTNDKFADIGYGFGWRLNYSQTIKKVELVNRTTTTIYYELTDGDGTRHYYKQNGSKYINELNKDSELSFNGSTATIKDKGDNKLIFACTSDKSFGRLTTIEDANGNQILISYDNNTISESNLRISSVQENIGFSNGQKVLLSYTNGHLSALTVPNGLNRTYTYSVNNDLSASAFRDGYSIRFRYSNHRLARATDVDETYNLRYVFGAGNRVVSVKEYSGDTEGQGLTFDYGWNCTAVTDNFGRDTIYQFNNSGQAISVRDNAGRAVFAAYNTAEQTITQISAVSKMQTTIFNLLKNHGFENTEASGNPWTINNASSAVYSSAYAHTGQYCLKMTSTSSVSSNAMQSVSVTAGMTYTFSAYFTGRSGAKLSVYNGNTEIAHSDPVPTIGTVGTDWTRGVVTFTAPSGVNSVKVKIELPNTSAGTVYVDSAQMEFGSSPNRYNMIQNGDFTLGMDSWIANDDITSSDGVTTDNSTPQGFSSSVYHMVGAFDKKKSISQTITVAGQKGDSYSFGAWLRSDSVPVTEQPYGSGTRTYGIKSISVTFLNGNSTVNTATVSFNADTTDWQFACGSAVANNVYTSVRVNLNYDYTRNHCYFDGIQLYRETFSQAYTYDDEGNFVGYKSLIGQENSFEYNIANDAVKSKDPRGNETTYSYNSTHNMTSKTSPEGVTTTFTINTKGQVYRTRIGDNSKYIETISEHGGAAALLTKVKDAREKETTYAYDPSSRFNTTTTDPNGNVSTYNYGDPEDMLRLVSLTSTDIGTVYYDYDDYGTLTRISRGATDYTVTYDNTWKQLIDTKVGDITLSTNAYDSHNRLSSVTYGNGFRMRYTYDELDRVTEIYLRANTEAQEQLAYAFIYNSEGDLYEVRNHLTWRASFFEYDHAGRCMTSKEREFSTSNSVITYGAILSSYAYQYDECNNLTKLDCSVLNHVWNTVYTYNKDNQPKKTILDSGKQITNSYDTIGRLSGRTIGLDSAYNISLTYVPGNGANKTTALIQSYENGSDDAYFYEYDDVGNIISITQGDTSITYKYDTANRLIRENNSVTNITYTYEYDDWGNITEKNLYNYTTEENLGSPARSFQYEYEDSDWCDLLTSYDDDPITYDNMGNPISYRGYTFDWYGKQLVGATKNANTFSFEYNEDGLRQKKTVNGTVTDYYYNGKVLIGMKRGTTTYLFSYDAEGNVVSVKHVTPQETKEYYYLRNAQGDIIKLIDGDGQTVVEYVYTAWGAKVSTTGSMASTLGLTQPFRYRGYVYDWETGFYYLQSRYYDPSTGRFISADVHLSTGQGVLGHNAFAYCGDNPIARVDTEGEFWHILAGAVIGAVIGAVTSVVSQVVKGEEVNWGAVAVSAAAGAVSGAINAACPCMGVVATGLVQGAIGAAAYAGTEMAYGRTPTVEGTLIAGITSGVFAAGAKALTQGLGLCQCFVAGTLVLTEDGQKPIEEIQEGDYVYASDPDTGESGYKRVVQTFERETDEIVRLQINGETITTTPGHPFYVPQKGWTKAIELRAGDILVTSNGEYVILEKIEHEILESPVKVFNFEVEEYHTYYVGSASFVLVHNSCAHKSSSWRSQKAEYWRTHQNTPSNLYELSDTNVSRMASGRAPIGYDGDFIQLHHVDGIANSTKIVPMTRASHTILHKFIGYSQFIDYSM